MAVPKMHGLQVKLDRSFQWMMASTKARKSVKAEESSCKSSRETSGP